jgi:hypothetical protein
VAQLRRFAESIKSRWAACRKAAPAAAVREIHADVAQARAEAH